MGHTIKEVGMWNAKKASKVTQRGTWKQRRDLWKYVGERIYHAASRGKRETALCSWSCNIDLCRRVIIPKLKKLGYQVEYVEYADADEPPYCLVRW